MIDGKRGALVEAIGAKTNQLTVDIDRVTSDALKSIETRGQTFSQSMVSQRLRRRADDHLGGRTGHRRGQQVAEGPGAVLARGDRPVASGLDRGGDRNAGDQQDPAHRHGRAVRAAARRQHPVAGSADRRPRQSQFAGARAGHARGRLRVRHERRHLAQRRRDPDAGRPVEVFNAKTAKALEDLGSLSGQFETHGKALVEAAAVVEQSNRNTTASVAERKAALESLVTHHRSAHHRSRSAAVPLHRPAG